MCCNSLSRWLLKFACGSAMGLLAVLLARGGEAAAGRPVDGDSASIDVTTEATEADVAFGGRFGRIVSAAPVRIAHLQAQRATVEAGGACTCDADCAVSGPCRVANCVTVDDAGVCQETNAPAATECDVDGLFCTDDRCNSLGVCVASTVAPCPSACTDTFRNCDTDRHCTSDNACQNKPNVVCNEAAQRCELEGGEGRCCDAGTCSYVDEVSCKGIWTRISDPDDLNHPCLCPSYSSGISSGTAQPEPGIVAPSPRKCAITGNVCATNDECFWTCVGGDLPGESCDADFECNPNGGTGVCTPPGPGNNECVDDTTECQALLSAGDDYTLNTASHLRLERFRFVGGGLNPKEIIVFDFYDDKSPRNLVDSLTVRLGHDQNGFNGAVGGGIREYVIEVDCGLHCDNIINQCTGAVGHPFCEQRLRTPFIIPPTGHIVARTRRFAAAWLGVDDSNFKWMSTDGGVTAGSNDAGSIWTGVSADLGAPGATNTNGGTNVLAFELEGVEISAAEVKGACCNPLTESCSDTHRWECTHCTASGAKCDLLRDDPFERGCGRNRKFETCSDKNWRGPRSEDEVDAGTQPGDLCGGGECDTGACCDVGTGGCTLATGSAACGVDNTFRGLGTDCDPNLCPLADANDQQLPRCSRGHNVCTGDADCDQTLGVCDAGTCYRGDLRQPGVACSVSAQDCPREIGEPPTLCISNWGSCTSPGTCNDDSTCNPDNFCGNSGADCCRDTFECDGGANDGVLCTDDSAICGTGTCVKVCDGPTPINISVPDLFTDPIGTFNTVVITGNSDGAVYKEDCSRPGFLHVGWYEHFTVDTCAELFISFCGQEPVYPVQAARLGASCPCQGAQTVFTDSNADGPQFGIGANCNNDFCCEEENFSMKVTVPAGTYQYEVSDDNSCAFGTGSSGDGHCLFDGNSTNGVPDCAPGDVCLSNVFPYQMTIRARPCRQAQCCGVAQVCSDGSGGGSGDACDVDDDCPFDEKCFESTGSFNGTCVLPCSNSGDCTGGASCDPTHTCRMMSEFACDSARGTWQGDSAFSGEPCVAPNGGSGGSCSIGSCCCGPGNCNDTVRNTAASCLNFDPDCIFHGNLACLPEPGGPAPINPDPCPVCPFESQSACQTDTGAFIYPADRSISREQVDDFRPAGGLIERICWGACWLGFLPNGASVECSGTTGGTRPPLAFEATFYEDDGGLPSNVPLHATYELVVDAEAPAGPNSRCWIMTAPLEVDGVPDPLQVQPGECHWMKLSGLGETQPSGPCLVSILSSNDGNNLRLMDNDGVFTVEDQKTNDIFFCLDSGLIGATAPPNSQDGGCGDRNVACCLPDGSCVDSSYTTCKGTPTTFKNAWALVGQTCASATCPAIPANDDCENAALPCELEFASGSELPVSQQGQCEGNPFTSPPIPGEVCDPSANGGDGDCFDGGRCTPWPADQRAYRCSVPSSNILASKDTPSTGGACPGASMNSDIWFEYVAPCTGQMTIRTCNHAGYDGMMASWVFDGGCRDPETSEDIVCENDINSLSLLQCDDDFCPGSATTEGISGEVAKGACVKVAVGGWAQNNDDASAGRGLTVLDIGFLCDPPPPCVCVPLLCGAPVGGKQHIQKQRFLTFCPNSSSRSTRMRVSLLDNGCSVTGKQCLDDASCTACDADSSNAGDPCDRDSQCGGGLCVVSGETCEEQSPPVLLGFIGDPVAAGGDAPPDTFIAAVVNTDPGFRVWEESPVHVTDCEIAPGRVYRIELEDSYSPGLFAGLDIRTTPKPVGKDWGDIVGHFDGVFWTPSNFLVNVDDISAMLKFLTLRSAPHITVVDLVGPGPTFVNMDVNATDLLILIKAFLGDLYPPEPLLVGGYPDLQNGESLTDCPAN